MFKQLVTTGIAYRFTDDAITTETWWAALEWCYDNFGEEGDRWWISQEWHMRDLADATAFKLRWC